MMIWSCKYKRKPDSALDRYIARLCCHDGQEKWGIHHWETYTPVVTWSLVRIMFILLKLNKMLSNFIRFTLVYPQSPIKTKISLYNPQGITLNDNGDNILKLCKNHYGLKDAGCTWWQYMSKDLEASGYIASEIDSCVYRKGSTVLVIYEDGFLIFVPNKSKLNNAYFPADQQTNN